MSGLAADPFNLVLAGVGGQGNLLASQVVAQAALRAGLRPTIGETYGVSQRGGSVTSHVRLATGRGAGPQVPRGQAHVLLGLEPLEAFATARELASAETSVLCNPRPVRPLSVLAGEAAYPPVDELLRSLASLVAGMIEVPAADLAREAGEPRAMNLVLVGALAGSGLLPLPGACWTGALRSLLAGDALTRNEAAFSAGLRFVGE